MLARVCHNIQYLDLTFFMKTKITYGILWWIIIFVEVSILGFIPFFATMENNQIMFNTKGYIIHFIFIALLALGLARTYYKNNRSGWRQGVALALVITAVSFLLDAIVTVPLFVKDYGMFYSSWSLWLSVAISCAMFIIGSEFFKQKAQIDAVVDETLEL